MARLVPTAWYPMPYGNSYVVERYLENRVEYDGGARTFSTGRGAQRGTQVIPLSKHTTPTAAIERAKQLNMPTARIRKAG